MAVYQVRFINPAIALDQTIAVPEGDYLLDQAEAEGIRLPAGCRQGNCSACVARLIEGDVDQSEQTFLRPAEVAAGYIVTCVAYPRSHCLLQTHQEGILYQSSLYLSTGARESVDGEGQA